MADTDAAGSATAIAPAIEANQAVEVAEGATAKPSGKKPLNVTARIQSELEEVEKQLQALDRESRVARAANERRPRPRPRTSTGARRAARNRANGSDIQADRLRPVRGAKSKPAASSPAGRAAGGGAGTNRPSTSSGVSRRRPAPPGSSSSTSTPDGQGGGGAAPASTQAPAEPTTAQVKAAADQAAGKPPLARAVAGASDGSSGAVAGARRRSSDARRRQQDAYALEAASMSAATLDAIVADATYRVAMSRVGVREEDLRVADEAEFRVDRSVFPPAKVSAADTRIRYEAYERLRLESLAAVLAERAAMGDKARRNKAQASAELRLLQQLDDEVDREEQRDAWRARRRKQQQAVLDGENERLRRSRAAFDDKAQQLDARMGAAGPRAAFEKKQQELQAKGRVRAAHIEKVKNDAKAIDNARWEAAQERFRQQDEKLRAKRELENQRLAEKRARLAAKQAHRDKVLEDMRARSLARSQQIIDDRATRERNLDAVRRKRDAEIHRRKLEADFRKQAKEKRVERSLRAQEYWRLKKLEKCKQEDAAYRRLKQLRHALQQKQQLAEKRALIAKSRQDILNLDYERNQEPGPGHYRVPLTFGNARHGFKMGDGDPKTDLDWAMLKASKEPGPGAYRPHCPGGVHEAKVARFAKSSTPSDLEYKILHSNDTPSPGLYQSLDFTCDSPAAAWGKTNPLTELDLAMKHGASLPAPGDYYSYEPSTLTIKQLRGTLQADAAAAETFNKKLRGSVSN